MVLHCRNPVLKYVTAFNYRNLECQLEKHKILNFKPESEEIMNCYVISVIIGFRALEWVKRYWETICEESR